MQPFLLLSNLIRLSFFIALHNNQIHRHQHRVGNQGHRPIHQYPNNDLAGNDRILSTARHLLIGFLYADAGIPLLRLFSTGTNR
ncbi:hypothetical protein EV696_10965 [Permianibacter aggregans]|uniref:Uncharacterized protein n=1 Tax=Permianibacter aggregans TaxID=1510150 RepID=A0A4R6ULA9_9GAMM|nr:hypothetical protein EV696_10965 [Permianibacter aggregans]